MKLLNEKKCISIIIPIILVIFIFTQIINFRRPLHKYHFSGDDSYFLIHEDWIDNNIKIIYNPFILDRFKNQLEIDHKDMESTPQRHFIIVKNNRLEEMIGYYYPDQVKISKEFEQCFEEYTKKEERNLTLSNYSELIDSLNHNNILWVGEQINEYEGDFWIYVQISSDAELKYTWSEINANLFNYLTSKYPPLTDRLNIGFSSSKPNDNFVTWKIEVSGNIDFEEYVKSIRLSDNNLISHYEYAGFIEHKYSLRYFELIESN